MSFGSAAISCSRTPAAFSNLNFLRWSATSSLSLRTSTWGFLAIGTFFILTSRALSRFALDVRACARLLPAPAAARPAARRRRSMTVTPGRQRDPLRPLARFRLLARLFLEVLDFGAGQLAHFPRAHAGDVDAAVVG